MRNQSHRLSMRSALMLGAALGAGGAAAAQTAPAAEEDQFLDTVIVTATPIRDSQAAAIEAKRSADNVLDVLAADTIGRFPDQNLADSLGRVPGLAIERDQGQARFINFRGAPFRYTKIAFDGIDVLGAEDGRVPRFDAFPAVITSRILVNKAITADMPGEAAVGFVDIETFTPFDRDGFALAAEAGIGNQELGDVPINKYNLRLSNNNGRAGFLVFGSHNLRGRITDNREYEYADTDGDGIDDSVVNLDFRSYRGEREDNAYGGQLEFRPTDTSRVFFSTLFSEFIDREERNQFDFDFDEPVALGSAGFAPLLIVTRALEDGRYSSSTFTNTLGADVDLGGWQSEFRLNYTETDNEADLPLPFSVGGVTGGTFDLADIEQPVLVPTAPFDPNTPIDVNRLDFAANLGIIFANGIETEAWKAKADFTRDTVLGGLPTEVRAGAQFDTREAAGGDALVFGGFPSNIDINLFVSNELWDSDFNNTIGGTTVRNEQLVDAWRAAIGGFDSEFDADSLIGIEEDVFAAYAMGITELAWGNVVYGLRVEATDFSTSGFLVTDAGTQPVTADNDYVHVLPSAHLNWDATEDVKVRVGFSSGLSRPRYSEVRASQSVDPIELTVSGGNPEIDPETTYGLDASVEWYYAPASLLAAGAYYRRIDDVIYPGSSLVDGSIYAPGLIAPGELVQFNSSFNGEDGELAGLELNAIINAVDFTDGWMSGFGASGNLTLVDSSFTAPTLGNRSFDLPGTSDIIYNASVFYENFGFSARLNYQYRDDWLSTTENDSLSEFWAETERVDASLRYQLPYDFSGGRVTLALNGNNLTDERDVRFINTRATPNQVEGFGRRWVASIRVDY